MKLYHYVHCPYCVRLRLFFGYYQIPYVSEVLAYDDEKTPVALTQKKMLPIVDFGAGGPVLNESLDIIQQAFQIRLKTHPQTPDSLGVLNYAPKPELESLIDKITKPLHNLAMPNWINTPEFTPSARSYFLAKKEKKRGPFGALYFSKSSLMDDLQMQLIPLAKALKPFYLSQTITLDDLVIAASLWGAYCVPEFQFPNEIHRYLQGIKNLCHFDYHEDFWATTKLRNSILYK